MNFLRQITTIANTGQARAILLTGNIYDLFYDGSTYSSLGPMLQAKLRLEPLERRKGITQVIYRINQPIEIVGPCAGDVKHAFHSIHTNDKKSFDEHLTESSHNTVYGFELLRQITECYRHFPSRRTDLMIIIESAHMHLPAGEITHLSPHDRRHIAIVHDWLSDPAFLAGNDTVLILAESKSQIHSHISRMPSILSVQIPLPSFEEREAFINRFYGDKGYPEGLTERVTGLSLHSLRQLLLSDKLSDQDISDKVADYLLSQIGEGVVEIKRPKHLIDDLIGYEHIKKFFRDRLIPIIRRGGEFCPSGIVISGPIGSGKTFICEAVAAELGCPVLILKGLRSMYYGGTDQLFDRLKQLVKSFHRIAIFVDEADTMFGGVDSDHDVERRLTGGIQGMQADTEFKGKVLWFMMTARPHRLSADMRRAGRASYIIPILDPVPEDRKAFLKWVFKDFADADKAIESPQIVKAVERYSAADFSNLRDQIRSFDCNTLEQAMEVADDIVLADIRKVREYQTLMALLNVTNKSFVRRYWEGDDFEKQQEEWREKAAALESQGMR